MSSWKGGRSTKFLSNFRNLADLAHRESDNGLQGDVKAPTGVPENDQDSHLHRNQALSLRPDRRHYPGLRIRRNKGSRCSVHDGIQQSGECTGSRAGGHLRGSPWGRQGDRGTAVRGSSSVGLRRNGNQHDAWCARPQVVPGVRGLLDLTRAVPHPEETRTFNLQPTSPQFAWAKRGF